MTEVGCFVIGRDEKTQYGPDWADAFLAGGSYTDYDDQAYFTVRMSFLVHPSVQRDEGAVTECLQRLFREAMRNPDLQLSMGDWTPADGGSLYWEDVEDIPIDIWRRHGIIPAWREGFFDDVDLDFADSSMIVSIDPDEDDEDDEDDEEPYEENQIIPYSPRAKGTS